MWYFVYSIIFMFAERSGTDLDKTDAACRNDREPFMKLTETGYAKINLGLDVIGEREDGYHEVRMVMQSIHLYDRVEIRRLRSSQIRVETNLQLTVDGGTRAPQLPAYAEVIKQQVYDGNAIISYRNRQAPRPISPSPI
jgi:hypothetical protein